MKIFEKVKFSNGRRRFYFFGIKIFSYRKKQKKCDSIRVERVELENIFFGATLCPSRTIDIVIPIYNGFHFLEPLFASIEKNTDLPYKLYVINDASPDKNVAPFLSEKQKKLQEKMELLTNSQNLGFLKSVNKCLQKTTRDVVILNTDVVVPAKWASRLCAPMFLNATVASVTPFSNAATIFSLPKMGDNQFDANLERVNQALQSIRLTSPLPLPTGVGFCMAMSRKALNTIGLFDEIFQKGYGEENDWCMRAQAKGFINTIAPNLFVWHKHGGSFESQEKAFLLQQNSKILLSKHPTYSLEIEKTLKNNNFLAIRFIAELLYCSVVAQKVEAWVDHTWGGGTKIYTFNKFAELKESTLCIRIQNSTKDMYLVSYYYQNANNSAKINFEDIVVLFEKLKIDTIVLNNIASYSNCIDMLHNIEMLKYRCNAKVSFRGHDYQSICPNITMLNNEDKYCHCLSLKDCMQCFPKYANSSNSSLSIESWHLAWAHFFKNVADELVVFSQSSKDIFERLYPDTKQKIVVIPHCVPPLPRVKVSLHSQINIGILGSIGINKGALIVEEMAELAKGNNNLSIKIIGVFYKKEASNLKILGEYEREDLPKIVESEEIDILFIPSIWPETFSYTTAEAMSMGLPVACFNLGAPAERVKDYEKGLVIDQIDAQLALEKIIAYVKILHKNKSI